MLGHLLGMERRLLLRNGVFWIVALVFGGIGFAMLASDNVSYGGGVGDVMPNGERLVAVDERMQTVTTESGVFKLQPTAAPRTRTN